MSSTNPVNINYEQILLDGKVVLITGANTGIGKVTAHSLAYSGATVYLACRSADKTLPVIEEIKAATGNDNIHFLHLDLASLDSVRSCVADFQKLNVKIDLLINNAGLAGVQGQTKDGFEMTFGVNHLGPFLLTNLLLPSVNDGGRIVLVSSRSHYRSGPINYALQLEPTKSITGMDEYQTSKLANTLHSKFLSKKLASRRITTYALHPGVVATEVWRGLPFLLQWVVKKFMLTVEQGAETTVYCATAHQAASESGLYYDTCTVRTESTLVTDEAAEELWNKSEEWVQAKNRT